ncbi:ABC transporter permease [Bauldia sp.]|uniref:ABC transporter permease n=1 Tax=Bauldia sp. TaxID=2575872 RepID=UPI003BA88691
MSESDDRIVPTRSGMADGSPSPEAAGSTNGVTQMPAGASGKWLTRIALAIAAVLAIPLLTVLVSVFWESGGAWPHLVETVLPRYVTNTIVLVILVGIGTLVVGTATAWLVTMYAFPGRRVLEWALVLPLTVPSYVIAYAYTDFLQHSGPVQTLLRDVTGWGPRDYWFPNVRSLGGAALMFVLVFYPYVYMLARAAFLRQSSTLFGSARTLGHGPLRAFFSVAMPLARPALAGGVALALMETLADFGAVAHFGVQTFTTGIYRTWFALGDRIAALHLATCLVGIVFVVIALERWQRNKAPNRATTEGPRVTLATLTGAKGMLAFVGAAIPLAAGFVIPVLILAELAMPRLAVLGEPRYRTLVANSFTLAGLGALITVSLALLLAYAARLRPGRATLIANWTASLGYALPGSIIAVGLLVPLAGFDNRLDALLRGTINVSTGLLLTGSIVALLYGYTVRFMAVALNTVEASLSKVTHSMDYAARTLGTSAVATLFRVHIPIIRGGLFTAALLVFVDVMKELPATLILRPFNFDTLAVQAYRLASDERLAQAAVPSLVIVVVGLAPVILLSRAISSERS